MNGSPSLASAVPFFLDAGPGRRFCLFHAPASNLACRGAWIYVHPFAEEMNKSRRMAALQARALAAAGYAVLQIDLYGCGDSEGDFADARWEIWKQDLATAHAWLTERISVPIGLWGVRLGATLALDFAASPLKLNCLLLWQPVLRGESFLTQFLRLQLAADMLAGQAQGESGTRALRDKLQAGNSVEVAGYTLAPALAQAIDAVNIANLPAPACCVHWLELTPDPNRPLPIPAARIIDHWKSQTTEMHVHQVECPAFWLSQETIECPNLVSFTTGILGEAI